MLFLSGDWLWPEAWIFGLWLVIFSMIVIIYLYRRDPALLAERFKKPGTPGQKGWDKFFVVFLMLIFIAWIVVMPLDAKRYGWTRFFPVPLKILGGMLLVPCTYFMFRAYAENTFASPLVRIQAERKQRVISTGVYGIIRHPLYLGGVFLFIGTPLLLGSLYGLLLGAITTLMVAARIIGEEKMLVNELEGYDEYRKKVRYRLVPFIW
jgi:protein-S-isoprenylcysteine O-methyltransferase Ste14